MFVPIWTFLHDKNWCSNIFLNIFCLFAGYIRFQPMCASFLLPWQINPFLNIDSSPYSSAASLSPMGCLPSAPTVGGWQRSRWWSITQWRTTSGKSGWQPRSGQSTQQPTIDGSGKGWWRLVTRARGQPGNWRWKRTVAILWQFAAMMAPLRRGGEGVQLLSLGAAPGCHLRRPLLTAALGGCIWWCRRHSIAAVMDIKKAVSRRQGQREADADSRCNNQIETTAVAAEAGGNGGHIRAMVAIDNNGNGWQWGGGKQGQQRWLRVLSVPSNGHRQMAGW